LAGRAFLLIFRHVWHVGCQSRIIRGTVTELTIEEEKVVRWDRTLVPMQAANISFVKLVK
jgi:hypothetical protein